MTRVVLTAKPLAPLVPVAPGAAAANQSPEWHDLRLFGRGRHPVNFEGGRERVVEV